MRIIIDPVKEGGVVIKLREEPAIYYDEKLNRDLDYLGAYYSKNGDLVEVRIIASPINLSESEFPKSKSIDVKIHISKKFFEEIAMYHGHHLKAEVYIPDKMPFRKYVFTFGNETDIPKACADHYNELSDTDDRLIWSNGRLIIERLDGNEIDYYERLDLRRAVIKDVTRWLSDVIYDHFILSVYKDRKLYF